MTWDIHPTKCFPQLYNRDNPSATAKPTPIFQSDGATLGGCSRTFVTLSKRRYEVFEKTPEYCSIFGLPDDCFDPTFEARMLSALSAFHKLTLWCFERTDYTHEKLEPQIELHYMKGEFLPSRYFMYVDTPTNFLKSQFSAKELEILSSELWYTSGKELIGDLNLNNDHAFRFEEKAAYYIRKKLICEFVRLALLLTNRDSFSAYQPANTPALDEASAPRVLAELQQITKNAKKENELYLAKIMTEYKGHFNLERLKNSRMMVMDVEYVHVPYPTDQTRSFGFPCIFSSLVWEGVSHGFTMHLNLFPLPCHVCSQPCKVFRKKFLNYDCLAHGFNFVEEQASLIEGLLAKHANFKIFTYGRADAFQLEQGRNFFQGSFEQRLYERRNRRRSQRIVDITKDLSVEGKSLEEIETGVLQKWLGGWARREPKININTRFMTRHGTAQWTSRYSEAIDSCCLDTLSAFLYLLHRDYKV